MNPKQAAIVVFIVVAVATSVTLGVVLTRDNDDTTFLECSSDLETPQEFSFEGDSQRYEIAKSGGNRLCTLVHLASDGTSFAPVARSYSGQDWEPSAGRFDTVISFDCEDETCQVTLPGLEDGSVYVLMTYEKPSYYQTQDVAARFLEQTTFGPKMEEIQQFSKASTLEFAQWIQDQQDNVPIMSHREVFRRHLNARYEVPSPLGPVTRPCDAGTRYRLLAFSEKDFDKLVTLETVATGLFRNKKIFSVNGHVRTIVDGPMYVYSEDSDEIVEADWEDGQYRICFVFETEEVSALLVDHPQYGQCLPIIFVDSSGGFGDLGYFSNPPVQFDASIGITPNIVVEIPDGAASLIDEHQFEGKAIENREIIVEYDLGNAVCDQVDPRSDEPVFAVWVSVQQRDLCI